MAEETRVRRNLYCVLVANLLSEATDRNLRILFKECGIIMDIDLKLCCDTRIGYVYVEFTDSMSVVSALALIVCTL